MTLVLVAVCCIGLAIMRTLQYRRAYWVTTILRVPMWTPPPPRRDSYSEPATGKQPTDDGFTREAVEARRARAAEIRATDNTEFIPDLFAYRCGVCSVAYVDWLDAFECHKK